MSLRFVIDQGEFYSLPFDHLLRLIHEEYPSELERLKTAYSVPASTKAHPSDPSPSQITYNHDYDEINRTLVSVSMLRKIHNNDYAGFAGGQQPAAQRLREPSFSWVRSQFQLGLTTPDDLYTLITSMVIGDLGKSPTLFADLQRATGDVTGSQTRPNHDLILYRVICQAPQLVPCLERVPSSHKRNLIRSFELGATFNFGQMAQAECPPASLVGLERLRPGANGNDNDNDKNNAIQVFKLHYLNQILDVAGALGHQDHTYSACFTESVYQSYRVIYEISTDLINGKKDRKEAYNAILVRKMELLVNENGWREKGSCLDINNSEHRALMRLLCICNATMADDSEIADLVWEAFFEGISDETRRVLVEGLNVDGSVGRPAVQATYAPAVSTAAIRATKSEGADGQKRALAAVFRYLARVHTLTEGDLGGLPKGVTVVERDIREKVLGVVTSESFRKNPDLLDEIDIPENEVAVQADL